MLSENVYVNQGGQNYTKVLESWSFIWKCPNCGSQHLVTKDSIEDLLNSDPHDPLYDYFVCTHCDRATSLMGGTEVKCNSFPGMVRSDGTFVYLKTMGKEDRIV